MTKTSAGTDRVIALIEALAPLWQERMGLSHWEIDHVFLDSYFGEDEAGDDFCVTAITECRWNYLEAKVKWFLPSAVRWDDARLESTLVHELCHVLLSAEQSCIVKTVDCEKQELTTEMVSRALVSAWGATIVP